MSDRLAALGPRPLFSVDGVTYSWADVLAAASARASLDELRNTTRRGLECALRAEAVGERLDPDAVGEAATSFRYEHGLLAAEELQAWLQRWELTLAEWGGYLERSLLLEQSAAELDVGETASPQEDAVGDAVYVDAVCSGFLEREALGFAADAALADLAADEVATGRQASGGIAAAAAAARAAAVSDAGVQREIVTRGLDWTKLDLDVLELADLDAAREAALLVRVDGRAMPEVAAACGEPLRTESLYLADAEPALQPSLVAAQAGELIGPVEHDGAFVLLAIHGRTPPAATDPELRRRAEAALVERAVKRAIDGRVEWHEHL